MPPGVVVTPPSLLVIVSPGIVISGVVSLPDAVVPPFAAATAVLLIWVTPAGTRLSTISAKLAAPLAPPARFPIAKEQLVPAALPFAQLQPAVLPAALNVVLAGTVSVSTTPLRSILPVLT